MIERKLTRRHRKTNPSFSTPRRPAIVHLPPRKRETPMSRSPCAGRHWAKLTWKRAGWGARSLSSSPPRSSMETLPRTAKGQQQQRSSTSPSWPLPFSTMQRARGCVQRESERSSVPLVQQARGEEGGREERGGGSARERVCGERKRARASRARAKGKRKKCVNSSEV